MKLSHRREFLHLAAGAAALQASSRFAWAQAYPNRPVRIIVGFPPGGGADIVTRLIGQWLSERLGQPFIIENRPGAANNIATEMAIRATPDGYTLLFIGSPNAINATLYEKLNFNFIRDVVPVAGISLLPNLMEVHPSVPAKTIPEFITFAKANPGMINYASGGIGTPMHVAGELFNMMAGVKMVHVPYRGSASAFPDVLSGRVPVMFDVIAASIEHIRSGKIRPLAVTTESRIDALPDIPPMGEFLPGYAAITWNGVGAPKGTPAEIVGRLNTEINAALSDLNVNARLKDLGGAPMPMTPAHLGEFIAEETEKWSKVVKFAAIKPE